MSENKQENKFFIKLKEHRKSKRISISEVANNTKINRNYIEAIEEGNFNVLPKVYVKLFIKTYSSYIGLESDKILIEYENLCSGKVNYKSNKTPNYIINKQSIKDSNQSNTTKPYFITKNKIIIVSLTSIIVFVTLYFLSSMWSYNIPEDWSNKKYFKELVDSEEIDLSAQLHTDSITINIKYLNSTNKFIIDNQKYTLDNNDQENSYQLTKNKLSSFNFKFYNGNTHFLIDGNKIALDKNGLILGTYDSGIITIEYYKSY